MFCTLQLCFEIILSAIPNNEVAVNIHVLLARVKQDPTPCQSEKSNTAFGYFKEYLQNVCERNEGGCLKWC